MPDAETSEFLLRACHDLRAAVRAVRAHSEMLLRSATLSGPDDFSQRLAFIVDGARKIDSVVDELSGYSLALQIREDEFTAVPMEALLRNALAKLAHTLRERNAEVTHERLPSVSGSADRLLRLWEDLLLSALSRKGGSGPRHIRISAAVQEEAHLFAVRDNGRFEPDDLRDLFKPFAPGLAISRAIVARHGGRIWGEVQADGTLAVFFTIPLR